MKVYDNTEGAGAIVMDDLRCMVAHPQLWPGDEADRLWLLSAWRAAYYRATNKILPLPHGSLRAAPPRRPKHD